MSVWLVARWEYIIRVRSRLFLLSTFLMPLLIMGIVFIPLVLVQPETSAGISYAVIGGSEAWGKEIDHYLDETYHTPDGTPLYRRYPLAFESQADQEQLASLLLREGIIEAYLLLSVDFVESGTVEYHSRGPDRRLEEAHLRRAVQAVRTHNVLEQYRIDPGIRESLERDLRWERQSAGGETGVVEAEIRSMLVPIMHVLILFFAIFLASQMLMRSILTERSNRVIEILLSSVSTRDLMKGKILGLGLVGLTQLTIYLLVAGVIGGFTGVEMLGPELAGYFLVYAILGYFFFSALFAALGSMFETEQEAQQVAGLLSLIPILPLVFSVYVMARPDALLVRAASFVPPLTPFLMIIRIAVSQVPWWEVTVTAAVLAIFTILMMSWAGSIFRMTILRPGGEIGLATLCRRLKQSRQYRY